MTEAQIKELLDRLAEFQSQRDAANLEKQALIDAVYTPEIKQRVAEIEAEFAGKTEAVNENIAALELKSRRLLSLICQICANSYR